MHDPSIFDVSQHLWDYIQAGFDALIVLMAILSYHLASKRRK